MNQDGNMLEKRPRKRGSRPRWKECVQRFKQPLNVANAAVWHFLFGVVAVIVMVMMVVMVMVMAMTAVISPMIWRRGREMAKWPPALRDFTSNALRVVTYCSLSCSIIGQYVSLFSKLFFFLCCKKKSIFLFALTVWYRQVLHEFCVTVKVPYDVFDSVAVNVLLCCWTSWL